MVTKSVANSEKLSSTEYYSFTIDTVAIAVHVHCSYIDIQHLTSY